MTIKCDVVKEMLPLYVDDLCSEENRKLVDDHLKNCGKCREALSALKSSISPESTVNKKETQKQRTSYKKIRTRVFLLCTGLIILVFLTINAARCIPHFYHELTMERYEVEIEKSSNNRL